MKRWKRGKWRALTAGVLASLMLAAPCMTMAEEDDGAVPAATGEAAEPADAPVNLELNAKSVVLMEAGTGRVLYENNASERLAPASVTKIMTLLLIMEAIEDGRIKVTDSVRCSEAAANMGGSQIWLEPGEEMKVDELLKAICVVSANDACVMMAEFISGSHESFVSEMNKRAQELGMTNTTFKNCTGLEDPEHRTTAYDIALMSRELIKHEKIFEYTTIWMDTLRDGKFGLNNTNKLIRFYEGANGLKTGSTDQALFCLSATAKRSDMQLIAVTLGSPTSKDRFNAASKLLDYGFANYAVLSQAKIPEIPPVSVLQGIQDSVNGTVDQQQNSILIPKGKENLITVTPQMEVDLLAPVEQNQIIGKMIVKMGDEVLAEYPIKAVESVARIGFFEILRKMFTSLV